MTQTTLDRFHIEKLNSFSDVDATEWNSLERGDFIFADHRFLSVLEDSGSLGRRTGWFPQILIARLHGPSGPIQGALTLFRKTNSYGEYIFDWAWANASEQAGHPYYPKLVAAIPFTPATGPKFLIAKTAIGTSEPEHIRLALLRAARKLVTETKASSLHFLFTTADETKQLGSQGSLTRHSFQYHWTNRDWLTFEDFLASLRAKRRSEIKRERAQAAALPVRIRILEPEELNEGHAETMYRFYLSTLDKMGGHSYLTREFFILLFKRMKEHVVLVLAETEDGKAVAGALNMASGRTLFGRYWGCLEEMRHLHFELCYYQTIEWAIRNRCTLFEAGAQGEHKFNRGFTPELTLSAHFLQNPGLSDAVSDFLEQEKLGIQRLFEDYKSHDPYKRNTPEEELK